jgi:hypothetical protein
VGEISRAAVFGKLNSATYKALEEATALCKVRGNPIVELEHWIYALYSASQNDLQAICSFFSVDRDTFAEELRAALDTLPRGANSVQDLGTDIESAVERAWVYSTLMFRTSAIRSGHLLIGMLKTPTLQKVLLRISRQFRKISDQDLTERFDEIVANSAEASQSAYDGTRLNGAAARPQRDIFISYRRSEAQHVTGRIFDHLERAFGEDRLFKDVDSIPAGVRDYSIEIESELRSMRVMLVVVGPTWLTVRDSSGRRRIDDKADLVRVELRLGLEREIPVIPLLFDGAVMPTKASLPASLKAFSLCQALPVRADPDFRSDMSKLVETCRRHLAVEPPRPTA